MIYLSIALVIIAAMAFFLINKWMDINYLLNTKVTEVAPSTAVEDQLKKIDTRINDTWAVISSTKEELSAFKLMMGLKGKT